MLLTRALAAADASAVLPYDFSRLAFVSVLAYALFGEIPDAWTWIGAAVILAATGYIAHRERTVPRSGP
jgi:drug/metabolite transporter (DMT)-like permease